MIRRVIVAFCLAAVLAPGKSGAQDLHLTQFYFSPLSINPAETGFFRNGIYRFTANFRNQWSFVPFPYTTYSASFEAKTLEKMMHNRDLLGTGIYLYNDKAGVGNIHSSGGALSVAFAKDFYQGMNLVAVGGQVAMKQIGFDPNVLIFGDQITFSGAAPATNETFPTTQVSYTDFNAGIFWNFIPNESVNMNTGLAAFHLNSPKISFLNEEWMLNKMVNFYSVVGLSMTSNFDLLPSFIYMRQKANNELLLGSGMRYNSSENTGVRFGMWYRNSRNTDSFVLMAGMDYSTLKAGISYDVNLGQLNPASKGRGAFELAIVYETGKSKRAAGAVKCPRL